MRTEAVRFWRRATGVCVVLVPVVGRKLCRTQSQPIEVAQNSQISVQIVAAFNIKYRRHLALGADTLDIVGTQRQLDLVAILSSCRSA